MNDSHLMVEQLLSEVGGHKGLAAVEPGPEAELVPSLLPSGPSGESEEIAPNVLQGEWIAHF